LLPPSSTARGKTGRGDDVAGLSKEGALAKRFAPMLAVIAGCFAQRRITLR
jgi:hypothetical protein